MHAGPCVQSNGERTELNESRSDLILIVFNYSPVNHLSRRPLRPKVAAHCAMYQYACFPSLPALAVCSASHTVALVITKQIFMPTAECFVVARRPAQQRAVRLPELCNTHPPTCTSAQGRQLGHTCTACRRPARRNPCQRSRAYRRRT